MTKNSKKFKFFGFLFIVGLVFANLAGAPRADASVLYHQNLYPDVVINPAYPGNQKEFLGTGLSGTVCSWAIAIDATITAGTFTIDANLREFSDASYTTFVANHNVTSASITSGNNQIVTFDYLPCHTFNSSDYYRFEIGGSRSLSTGEVFSLLGLASGDGNASTYADSSTLGSLIPADLAYSIDTGHSATLPLPDLTNRVTLESPVDLSTTSSTSVTLNGHYYHNSSVTFSFGNFSGCNVHLEVVDGLGGITPSDIPVICSIDDSYTAWTITTSLITGRQYMATAQLIFTNSYGVVTVGYHSSSVTFNVASAPTDDTLVYSNCSITAIVGCFQNMFIYLFKPSQSSVNQFKAITLEDKIPFSYIYDMGNVWDEIFANTGTREYLVVVHTGALGNFTLISEAQISAIPYSSTIKTFLEWIIYLFTAYTCYRLIIKVHDKK